MVRIQDSQSWHRGSIPLSTTTKSGLLTSGESALCCCWFGGSIFGSNNNIDTHAVSIKSVTEFTHLKGNVLNDYYNII